MVSLDATHVPTRPHEAFDPSLTPPAAQTRRPAGYDRARQTDRRNRQLQTVHLGYVLSGRLKVVTDDGTEGEVGPGDVCSIAPGHDAWTVGDEACVTIDFGGIEHYAKR